MPYLKRKNKKGMVYIMNIGMILLIAFMCIVGLGSTFYIVGSMFYYLGFKIIRKIKYGTPLYD